MCDINRDLFLLSSYMHKHTHARSRAWYSFRIANIKQRCVGLWYEIWNNVSLDEKQLKRLKISHLGEPFRLAYQDRDAAPLRPFAIGRICGGGMQMYVKYVPPRRNLRGRLYSWRAIRHLPRQLVLLVLITGRPPHVANHPATVS